MTSIPWYHEGKPLIFVKRFWTTRFPVWLTIEQDQYGREFATWLPNYETNKEALPPHKLNGRLVDRRRLRRKTPFQSQQIYRICAMLHGRKPSKPDRSLKKRPPHRANCVGALFHHCWFDDRAYEDMVAIMTHHQNRPDTPYGVTYCWEYDQRKTSLYREDYREMRQFCQDTMTVGTWQSVYVPYSVFFFADENSRLLFFMRFGGTIELTK